MLMAQHAWPILGGLGRAGHWAVIQISVPPFLHRHSHARTLLRKFPEREPREEDCSTQSRHMLSASDPGRMCRAILLLLTHFLLLDCYRIIYL